MVAGDAAAQIMAAAASTAKMRANRYAPTPSATPKQKIASKASRLSRRTVGFMAGQLQNSPGPRVIRPGLSCLMPLRRLGNATYFSLGVRSAQVP